MKSLLIYEKSDRIPTVRSFESTGGWAPSRILKYTSNMMKRLRLAPIMVDLEAEALSRLDKIGAGADQAFSLSQVQSSGTVCRQASGWCSSR